MTIIRQTEKFAKVTPDLIERLCEIALSSERRKSVALLHSDENDQVQEMLIALAPKTFVDRHRTKKQSESIYVVKGLIAMAVFTESGALDEVLTLSNDKKSKLFGVRLSARQWQAYMTGEEVAVLHEIACGPFISTNTEHWALDEGEVMEIKEILRSSLSDMSKTILWDSL